MKKEASEYPSLGKPQNNGYSYFEKHPMIPNLSV